MGTTLEDLQSAIDGQKPRAFVTLGGEDEDVNSITQALRGPLGDALSRSGVCSLRFNGEDYAGWDTNEVPDLFQVIGEQQEGITKLAFEAFVPEFPTIETVFPLRVLTNLLRQMRCRLEGLYFDDVVLNGSTEDFHEFLQVVSGLVCLRCCCLQDTVTIMRDMATPMPVDGVLAAISRLPLLLEVVMETRWWESATPGLDHWTTTQFHPVQHLCTDSSIQSLHFHFLHPNNTAFHEICRTLETNTTLNRLVIQFASFSDENNYRSYFEPFAQFLQSNTVLEELDLEFRESPNLDSIVISIANAIANNSDSCLGMLNLSARCDFGTTVEGALVRLMQSNYGLRCLDIRTVGDEGNEITYDSRSCAELELYIRLNCHGRKTLMNADDGGSATREQFVQAFAKLSNDLDALYYYLRMNPWLCQKEAPAMEPASTRAAKRRRLTTTAETSSTTLLSSEQSTLQSSLLVHDSNTKGDLSAAYADALLEIERLRKENAGLKARLPGSNA